MKHFLIILSIVCVGLGVGLVLRHTRAQEQLASAREAALNNSNLLIEARGRLAEQEKLSAYLQSTLNQKATELALASNNLALTEARLTSAQNDIKSAQTELKSVQSALQTKSTRVAELEAQNDDMTKKLSELAGSINTLEGQIAETKRKLAAAEGDRAYLTKELARLQSDKSELLRQFNDLAVLRAQVAMLREEAAINQRLSWMAQGVYLQAGRKGAEALMHNKPNSAPVQPRLDVEFEQGGGARVAPPEKK